MRVGIVTITNGPYNYGNQLQNCAVIEILGNLNIKAETLFFVYGAEYLASIKHKMKNVIFSIFACGDFLQARRELAFGKFSRQYVKYTKPIKKYVSRKMINRYDYFICGSDQIWNPYFSTDDVMWNYYLLSFVPEFKRISLAASIGTSNIPNEKKHAFVDMLNGYKSLSVREDTGAELIKLITGRMAETVIDPTLMLSKEYWNKIAKKTKKVDCDRKYVIVYFLGDKSEKVFNQMEELKKMGYEIYNFLEKSQPYIYTAGPSEFIYLISHAQLILTDSFHACVFSFIFNKPFVVYDRKGTQCSMNSRIETLLKKFDLERKYANSNLENDIWEHNYEKGYEQLELERTKVLDFLRKALNVDM